MGDHFGLEPFALYRVLRRPIRSALFPAYFFPASPDNLLPAVLEMRRRSRSPTLRVARPSPSKLRISWNLSGEVYLEKDMVDPTKKLGDSLRELGSLQGMRFFIADTDVQVFSDATPLQIFKSYNDKEEFNILDLQCARVSHSR